MHLASGWRRAAGDGGRGGAVSARARGRALRSCAAPTQPPAFAARPRPFWAMVQAGRRYLRAARGGGARAAKARLRAPLPCSHLRSPPPAHHRCPPTSRLGGETAGSAVSGRSRGWGGARQFAAPACLTRAPPRSVWSASFFAVGPARTLRWSLPAVGSSREPGRPHSGNDFCALRAHALSPSPSRR
jgi:hypothetical protein